MAARNQYLQEIQNEYLQAPRKQKATLLNEAEKRTRLNRKYLICKLSPANSWQKKTRKKRKEKYNNEFVSVLTKVWRIFDRPCGQRLVPLLKAETDRLRSFGELVCSEEVARKLKEVSFRTIDEKLKHQKIVEGLKNRYSKRTNPLLYQKIPVKLSDELDRTRTGNVQIDLVEHCGQSTAGEYICTLSTVDVSTGWWEGEAVRNKGQYVTFKGITSIRNRFPFRWNQIHSDNGSEFINWHLFRYSQNEKLGFSRSRPFKKNDNCFVEQKNWTHVKKFVGYYRYDTREELETMNNLYRNEFRLYKNFFQPIIKLVSKERIGGKIKRVYDAPKTPYQMILEAKGIPKKIKQELKKIYLPLNPAQLKRKIDSKLNLIYEAYKKKDRADIKTIKFAKKLRPRSVRYYIAQPETVRLGT